MLVVSIALAISIVFAVAAFVAFRRMSASGSTQAMASEQGWALAGGASIGPLAVSGARMHGVRGAWAVHLFGRRIVGSNGAPRAKPERAKKEPSAITKHAVRVAREIDPIVALEMGLDVFGRVRVESIAIRVRGGDPDPLLMGRVAGVLAVLGGILAPVARIDSSMDWAAEESSLDVSVTFEASFVPAVVAYDIARFVARQLMTRLRKAVARRRNVVPQLERA